MTCVSNFWYQFGILNWVSTRFNNFLIGTRRLNRKIQNFALYSSASYNFVTFKPENTALTSTINQILFHKSRPKQLLFFIVYTEFTILGVVGRCIKHNLNNINKQKFFLKLIKQTMISYFSFYFTIILFLSIVSLNNKCKLLTQCFSLEILIRKNNYPFLVASFRIIIIC